VIVVILKFNNQSKFETIYPISTMNYHA